MTIYSHTRLASFEDCPRQYYYRYIRKLSVEAAEGIELLLGKCVHSALEKLYRDRLLGKHNTAEELVEVFNADWQKAYHGGIVVVRTNLSAENYRRSGEECLRRYYARHEPFDESTTIAVEERVLIDLDGSGRYVLQGYIDRISQRSDGTYEIHDYKTNVNFPSQADKDSDRQLALYQLGIEKRWNDVEKVELVWHFLRFGKEIRSTRTQQDMDTLREETVRLIDDIESRNDEAAFETCESKRCDWCPFQSSCPARKHLFKTEALPVNQFLGEPGVKLVNHHTTLTKSIGDLKTTIARLDQERDEVIEALHAYAEREGATTIVGTDREARTSELVQITLPRKGSEAKEYAELERHLRASDAWPAVSSLDTPALRRIWLGDENDPGDVRQIIEPFVGEEQAKRISFRKRTGNAKSDTMDSAVESRLDSDRA